MKRLDLVFIAVVAGLAVFVGVEARGARVYADTREGTLSASPIGDVAPAPVSEAGEPTAVESEPVPTDVMPGITGDVDDVERRLAARSEGTYIDEILAIRDSAIARWPDRRTQALRVWIQPTADVPHFQAQFVSLVQGAFDEWVATGIPLAFSFVRDSASADIHVTWIDHFNEQISGKTLWAHDDDWWIVEANIVLAVHHHSGDTLEPAAVRAIALHEVGHLIGLDHTSDTTNIMTAKVRVKELSPADRLTARLLYSLPAGSMKRGAKKRAR